jgi:hypothetical protein
VFRIDRPGWSLEPDGNIRPRGMAASGDTVSCGIPSALQNPAYRPPGEYLKGPSKPMRTRLSICARKARYPSREAAQQVAAEAELPLRAYRCDRCWQFHLTSRIKCR